jgi:hypothetical protein
MTVAGILSMLNSSALSFQQPAGFLAKLAFEFLGKIDDFYGVFHLIQPFLDFNSIFFFKKSHNVSPAVFFEIFFNHELHEFKELLVIFILVKLPSRQIHSPPCEIVGIKPS